MRQYLTTVPDLRSIFPVLFPVVLWAMLFLGLGAGRASELWAPLGPRSFIDGVRAVLPFTVAGSAAVFIVYRTIQGYMPQRTVLGPLGLATAYGLMGFVAAFNSPDGNVALWWTGLYLSVPIVLWGVVWSANPLEQLRPLVNATWLAVILACVVLLAVAVFKLDFIERVKDPSLFLDCRASDWFDLTSGRIRGTGVGRYAAITALIAISGMWMPKWRRLWSVVLFISLVFLLYTAARGSFAGFGAGAALMVIIYTVSSGKRAMATALVVIAVAVPVLWGTGAINAFLENCFFRSPPPVLIEVPEPSGPQVFVAGFGPDIAFTYTETEELIPVKPTGSTRAAGEERVNTSGAIAADGTPLIPEEFYRFSGRQAVWSDGWELFKKSPVIGYGFHADRLLLGTHMHNSVMHAMLQTGVLGTVPFVLAIILAWILVLRLVLRLSSISASDKHLVIQCAGVLAFLTMRSFPESTAAFFGVDWLILAVILFYVQIANSNLTSPKNSVG